MFIITRLISWLKGQIRDQFGFSKAETNGVLILLGLIFCFLTIPYGLDWYYKRTKFPTHEADIALLDATLARLKNQRAVKDRLPEKRQANPQPLDKLYKKQQGNVEEVKIKPFDINTAESKQLELLPGIGSTRAARIIKYRDKLGGFVCPEQYSEIYGLDSLAIASMLRYSYISSDFQPKKININQDDFKTLLAHPYLSYEQVQHIFQFRNKRGRFTYIEEVLENNILEEATFKKIKAYLAV